IIGLRALRRITLASTVAYLGIGMFIVACPLLGRRYLGGAAEGALLLAVLAAASLVATAATARWPVRLPPDTLFLIATATAGGGLAALAFAPAAAPIIAAVALTGLADGPQLAAVFAVRQREAPPRLRGQIFTTAASLKLSAGALGAALAGALSGYSATVVLVAAAAAQAAALLSYLAAGRGRPAAGVAQVASPAPEASPAREAAAVEEASAVQASPPALCLGPEARGPEARGSAAHGGRPAGGTAR